MKSVLALIIVAVVLVLLVPITAEAQGANECIECRQICWGWLGCEFFCVLSAGSGWERCYAYAETCSHYEHCWVYLV